MAARLIEGLSALLLVGGRSRRMGRDKASLLLDGRPCATVLCERLLTLTPSVTVLARVGQSLPDLPDGVERIDDEGAEGPLFALTQGLSAVGAPLAFVLACDHPAFDPSFARFLAHGFDGFVAAVPILRGRPQPLHAMYRAEAIPRLKAALLSGERSVLRAVLGLKMLVVEEERWRAAGLCGEGLEDADDEVEWKQRTEARERSA